MITAVFTSGFDHTEVSGLWQYDYGQKLRIQGLSLPPAVEIHFSLQKSGGDSESRIGVTKDGVTELPIPDSMLENGGTIQNYYIYAFIYLTDEASGKTVKWIQLHVNSRPKPEAFDSPEEKELFREAIAAVNDSADRAETAEKSSEAWAHGHEDYPERDENNAKFYSDKAGEKAEETALNLQEVNNLTNQVKENAETVASDKNAVEEFKNKAGESAEKAAVSESNAALHENNAKDAQSKAEEAQKAAEEAKEQVAKDKEEVLIAKTAVEKSEENVAGNKEYVRQTVENFTSFAENAVESVNTAGQNQVVNIEEAGQAALDNISNGVDESLTQSGKAADAKVTGEKFTGLEHDVEELNDKKITKFYASNLGNTNLKDSDNGKITDVMLYGKSEQFQGEIELEDGTTVTVPCPDYPQEIKSVVNPVVKMTGKNLLNPTLETTILNGITCTNNGDGTYIFDGTASNNAMFKIIPMTTLKLGICKVTGCPIGGNGGSYYLMVQPYTSANTYEYGNGAKFNFDGSEKTSITIVFISGTKVSNLLFKPMITRDLDATYEDFEPYEEQTTSLPYTLNAIPVSSGGNVTIDSQEYIADYVDVERGKLVRMIGSERVINIEGNIYNRENGAFDIYNWVKNFKLISGTETVANAICNALPCRKPSEVAKCNVSFGIGQSSCLFIFISKDITTLAQLNEYLKNNEIWIYSELKKPIEIDLTDEEVQAFKDLSTYYPTTNVFITSDKLEGYTEFNYPLNMKNGWDYVMQQIEETRPIIYDTEVKVLENKIDTAILTAMMEG